MTGMDVILESTLVLCLLLYYRKKKAQECKRQRFWIHPINSTRFKTGHFHMKHPLFATQQNKQ